MKRIISLIVLICCSLSAFAGKRQIVVSQLPEKAQLVVLSQFKDTEVSSVYVERRASLTQYEVAFKNGDEIQFNANGQWTEIKCHKRAVPDFFIPEKIKTIVSSSYPENYIKEVEHNDKLYEIVLDNKIGLTFNRSFRLIDIDK